MHTSMMPTQRVMSTYDSRILSSETPWSRWVFKSDRVLRPLHGPLKATEYQWFLTLLLVHLGDSEYILLSFHTRLGQ